MKVVELTEPRGNIAKFFKENNVTTNASLSSGKNESIDGTGGNPSVRKVEADNISKYILKKFSGDLKVIDVGTGVGYMVKSLIEHGADAYGIEGFAPLAAQAAFDKQRMCAWDLATVKIENEDAFKCATLTTSFEVFEHVHRKHEDLFLRNLAYLSDFHLAGIHMYLWPGVNKDHCNIKHECCWVELFRKHNIKCEILGHRTGKGSAIAPGHEGTAGSFSGQGNGPEEFRDETGTHNWEESMFCVLDMRDFRF